MEFGKLMYEFFLALSAYSNGCKGGYEAVNSQTRGHNVMTVKRGNADYLVDAGGERLWGKSFGNQSEAVFLGIPYAKAPVSELRWRPPEAHVARSGTRPACVPGPVPPQHERIKDFYGRVAKAWDVEDPELPNLPGQSEDCLFLNVWTPNWKPDNALLPVMVWIHGGSNKFGWGSQAIYNGAALARKEVVVVTINYRLGILGFMAHPELSAENETSGNYGLLDQVAALDWVQENIEEFGGDPACVTIFGQSAGSLDVIHLMACPRAKKLFHRAIAQSGATLGMKTREEAEQVGLTIAENKGDGTLASLRSLTPMDLVDAVRELEWRWGPIHDGQVLEKTTKQAFSEGLQNDVPLIIGTVEDELSVLPRLHPKIDHTVSGYREWLGTRGVDDVDALLSEIRVLSTEEVKRAAARAQGDLIFTCPSINIARDMAKVSSPAFMYRFTHALDGGDAIGAFHGIVLHYVFDTHFSWMKPNAYDRKLVDTIMGYWTQFAATGDPNPSGLDEWPRFDSDEKYLDIGDSIQVKRKLRAALCG